MSMLHGASGTRNSSGLIYEELEGSKGVEGGLDDKRAHDVSPLKNKDGG